MRSVLITPSPRASRTIIVLGLVLVLALAGACQKGPAQTQTEDQRVRVEVTTVGRRPFQGGLPITGELRPVQEVTIKSRVAGNVVELPFDEGDTVKKGQLVARIEDLTPQAQLRSSRASVLQAQAQLARAEADLDRAGRDQQRTEMLHTRGAADTKSLDDSRITARLAAAALQAAQAQLEQARAGAEAAAVAVAETQYRAPFDGVISRRGVARNEYIDTFKNRDLITLVDNSSMELVANVVADLAVGVQRGARVDFLLAALPGKVLSGEVIAVNPAVDPRTRTVRLRVRIPNPEGLLKGGLFATGRVVVGGERRSVAVPSPAVHHESGAEGSAGGEADRDVVWRVKGGVADQVLVRVGVQEGDYTEVLSGLAEGDQVVISSPAALRQGLAVTARVVGDQAAPAAGPAPAPAPAK